MSLLQCRLRSEVGLRGGTHQRFRLWRWHLKEGKIFERCVDLRTRVNDLGSVNDNSFLVIFVIGKLH